MQSKPTLIIIQGGPAVGKTTLARALGKDLGWGVLSKDDIKELLFDRVGLPIDRDESRWYGRATMAAMFVIANHLVTAGRSFIMESAFHKNLAEKDFAQLQAHCDVDYIQIYCHASHEVQQARCRQRAASGNRHAGHFDAPDMVVNFAENDSKYQRLKIAPAISVNTTNFGETEYGALLKEVRTITGRIINI